MKNFSPRAAAEPSASSSSLSSLPPPNPDGSGSVGEKDEKRSAPVTGEQPKAFSKKPNHRKEKSSLFSQRPLVDTGKLEVVSAAGPTPVAHPAAAASAATAAAATGSEVQRFVTVAIPDSVSSTVRRAIIKAQRDGPSDNDRPGYLYMFTRPGNDKFSGLVKIGRTSGLPEKRVKAWGKDCTIVHTVEVRRNQYAETMAHRYLSACRRTVDGETEWFAVDKDVAAELLRQLCTEINMRVPKREI